MQPLQSGHMSIPGSLKTWTWKLPPILASQITENHKKVSKVGPRSLPKCILKSVDPLVGVSRTRLGRVYPS